MADEEKGTEEPGGDGTERLYRRILRGMERERYADGVFSESMEELAEKRMLLDVLRDAMDSLLPEERELAMKVFGEEMQVSEFAKSKNESRTTVSSRKQRVLEKLRLFFESRGFDVHK